MMRPFWCYFGGKWRAAPRYPEPRYSLIVEPFAGAAGYSTRYGLRRKIVLIDKDPTIAGLWKWLIAARPDDILSLPDLEDGQTVDDLDVPQQARHLIGFWLNKGTARPCKRPGAWMREGIRPDSMWARHPLPGRLETFWGAGVRQRIALQVTQIRHWEVIHGDYSDGPAERCVRYVDPPYQEQGKHYRHGSARIDFQALGEWCKAQQGQTIVCEQNGADWLPFRPFGEIRGTAGSGRSGVSSEVIWTNGSAQRQLWGDS